MTQKIASKEIDVNEKIVEELLSKADPSELFGRDGLFNQLKKQIVERVLSSELEHDLGYSKHSKAPKAESNQSLAVLALVMVSWVVNVFEAMINSVVSGSQLLSIG